MKKAFLTVFLSIFLISSLCSPFGDYSFASERDATSSIPGALNTEQDVKAYKALLNKALNVANGDESSTAFELTPQDFGITKDKFTAEDLGVSSLLDYSGGEAAISVDAVNALYSLVGFDCEKVMTMLIHTAPYELYWYDKVMGYNYSYPQIGYKSNAEYPEGYLYLASNNVIKMNVIDSYASNGEAFKTDISLCKNAQAVLKNAEKIVDKYKGKSDFEKLIAYKNEICNAVSYDYNASGGHRSYGNQWQMIWVFDNDPNTNVVCEGYAKAFQYLCQISDFSSSNISCISVTGITDKGIGAGEHMWNIVSMEDGKNYIVDITNCDEGSIGYPNKLFLTGVSGNALTGYTAQLNGEQLSYTYDYDMHDLYNLDALTLSDKEYNAHSVNPIPTVSPVKNVKATNAGKNRVSITWDAVSGAEGYLIYGRRKSAGDYGYIGMTTKGTTFTDINALDTDYNFYWVYAYVMVDGKRVVGPCDGYTYAKGTTLAPTGIKASGAGKKVVQISWNKVEGADGYLVYGRHSKNGTYGYITMTTGATTAKDTKALDKDFNFYWVFAYHFDKNGNRVIGSTPQYVYAKGVTAPITKEGGLTATNVSGGVKISWKEVKDAAGYIVYAKRPGSSSFSYIGMTTKNLYYTDKVASKTDWTFYRVFPYHLDASGNRIVGESGDYVYGKAK